MKIKFLSSICIFLGLTSFLYSQPNKIEQKEESQKWEYSINIYFEGTRSERRYGKLTLNGKSVSGKKDEVVKTPFGKFKWFDVSKGNDAGRAWKSGGWLNFLPLNKKVFDDKDNP